MTPSSIVYYSEHFIFYILYIFNLRVYDWHGQDSKYNVLVSVTEPGQPQVLASGLCGTTFKRAWASNKVRENESGMRRGSIESAEGGGELGLLKASQTLSQQDFS